MKISLLGIHFNIIEIILLLFLILYVPAQLVYNGCRIRIRNPKLFNIFIISFALYLCFILISITSAQNDFRVIKAFLKWAEILIFSILIFLYVHNFENFKKIYWIFWISNFGFILVVLINIFLKKYGLFDHRIFPSYSAAIALALLLPFAGLKSKIPVIFSVLCFFSAFLSLSRGVWLILLIFIVLILKDFFLKKKKLTICLAFIFGVVTFLFTPIGDLFEFRMEGTKASNIERIGMAKLAIQAFKESPVTGIGSLNFPNYFMSNADRSMIRSEQPELLEPHNVFLQIAAEEGVFALFSFGVLIFIIYYVVFNGSKSLTTSIELLPYLTGLKYLAIVITVNLLFGFISDQFRLVYASYFGLSLSILRLKIKDEKMHVFSQ